MAYTINGVNVSDYGIIPGRIDGSNIAVSGWLNLPIRMGETSHEWAESDGVEPYVLADEIDFAGIDITFSGVIKGTRVDCIGKIQDLLSAVNALSGTFIFSTPYGDFEVYLKNLTTKQETTVLSINLIFHQPVVSFPALTLPSTATAKSSINGIPFGAFGLILKSFPDYAIAEMREQDLTVYNAERFKKTKRSIKKVTIECVFAAPSVGEFISRGKLLRKLFSDPGTKEIRLNDSLLFSAYATDGFEVSGITTYGDSMIADFKIQLIIYTESTL